MALFRGAAFPLFAKPVRSRAGQAAVVGEYYGMETFLDPAIAPGQNRPWTLGPMVRGPLKTIAEATNGTSRFPVTRPAYGKSR